MVAKPTISGARCLIENSTQISVSRSANAASVSPMRRKNSQFNCFRPVGESNERRHETLPHDCAGVSATGLVGCRKAPLQEEPTLGFSEGCLSASMHSAAAFVLPATRVSNPFTRPRTGLNPAGQTLERQG